MDSRIRFVDEALLILGLLALWMALATGRWTRMKIWGTTGLWCAFLFGVPARVLLPQTEYAAGYSETTFSRVNLGMPEAEVINILGEPFLRNTNQAVLELWYTRPQKGWYRSAPYWRARRVEIRNGVVTARWKYVAD